MQKQTGVIVDESEIPADEMDKYEKLSPAEYNLIKQIPEDERGRELAVLRYNTSRLKLGRKPSLEERNAFRLGYEAGKTVK